jgi:molybdopterin converting factor small subunit
MKIKLELFGASREFSKEDYLEFDLKEKSSIEDLRHELLNFVENNFKGNDNFKKLVKSSRFCSEENNIVADNYKIIKDQKIGIIPPIGGG